MIGDKSGMLGLVQAMARHAAARQATVTENLAHANTPGYKTRDVAAFADAYAGGTLEEAKVDRTAAVKPNGNSVNLEAEVTKLAEAKGQHDMALGVWRQTLSLYNEALGRRS